MPRRCRLARGRRVRPDSSPLCIPDFDKQRGAKIPVRRHRSALSFCVDRTSYLTGDTKMTRSKACHGRIGIAFLALDLSLAAG